MKKNSSESSKRWLDENGFFNIYKEKGCVSTEVVRRIKGTTGIKKIGHMGTLDPIATGVLVIGINKGTDFFEYFKIFTKRYRALIILGLKTDTDDITGRKIEEKPFSGITEGMLRETLKKFEGEIEQIPPLYSAVRVDGERAYNLARKGIGFILAPKKVRIYSITLLSFSPPYFEIDVVCGGGTYIRALARDIGEALGTGAALAELERTEVGPFSIKNSVKLEKLLMDPESHFIPLKPGLFPIPHYEVSSRDIERIRNGDINFLKEHIQDESLFGITCGEMLLAVGQKRRGGIVFINLIK